jgi:hypothetical protein
MQKVMFLFLVGTVGMTPGWSQTPAPLSSKDISQALKEQLQDKVNFSGDFEVKLTTKKLSISHEHPDDKLILEEVHFSPDQRNFQAILVLSNGDKTTRLKVIPGKIEPLRDIPPLT